MSDLDSRHVRRLLIQGLVGNRQHQYENSATFFHAVNLVADMLPMWIDGIAANAARTDERLAVELSKVTRGQA